MFGLDLHFLIQIKSVIRNPWAFYWQHNISRQITKILVVNIWIFRVLHYLRPVRASFNHSILVSWMYGLGLHILICKCSDWESIFLFQIKSIIRNQWIFYWQHIISRRITTILLVNILIFRVLHYLKPGRASFNHSILVSWMYGLGLHFSNPFQINKAKSIMVL